MNKIILKSTGGIEKNLILKDLEIPKYNSEEVLIRVDAAALNPVDTKIAKGELALLLPFSFKKPEIGFEFSGIVHQLGDSVNNFNIGDKVFGRVPLDKGGAYSEFLSVDTKFIALAPKKIKLKEASSLPQAGLTVLHALSLIEKLHKNGKILIIGASGGIGSFAIQYFKNVLGYHVTAVCHSTADNYVRQLGADMVLNYDTSKNNYSSDYDLVLDCVGGKYLFSSIFKLKRKGKLISLTGPTTPEMIRNLKLNFLRKILLLPLFILTAIPVWTLAMLRGVKYIRFLTETKTERLKIIRDLVDKEIIVPTIDTTYDLLDFRKAFNHLNQKRIYGKVILEINSKEH